MPTKCKTGLKPYRDKVGALTAVHGLVLRDDRVEGERVDHICPECGQWHITEPKADD